MFLSRQGSEGDPCGARRDNENPAGAKRLGLAITGVRARSALKKKTAPVSLGLNRGRLVRSCRVPQEGPLGTEHGYKIPAITSATIVL